MAIFTGIVDFNVNYVNLNWLYENAYDSYYKNGVNYIYDSVKYEDVYEIYASDGEYDEYLYIYGKGISSSGDSGTVQLMGYGSNDSNSNYWWATGLSISVSALLKAAQTSSTVDDLKIFATAFSGNDTFNLSNSRDVVNGFAGSDTVSGNGGDDDLYGGLGDDKLTGGTDEDYFVFDTKLNSSNNVDTITDFIKGTDEIVLDDDIFSKLNGSSGGKSINSSSYIIGSKAKDTNDYIFYNTSNDTLYYDTDGSGKAAAIAFAIVKLSGTNAPSYSDFLIIA